MFQKQRFKAALFFDLLVRDYIYEFVAEEPCQKPYVSRLLFKNSCKKYSEN